jgi:hypothetical protein
MKKLLVLFSVLLTCLLAGCAKGEITLEVTRLGAADLTCKLTTLPVLQPTAEAFEEDFKNDGYSIQKISEGEYKGFQASKHYNQLKDIKDSKVLHTFDFDTWEQASRGAVSEPDSNGADKGAKKDEGSRSSSKVKLPDTRHRPIVTMHGGLLFDTIDVNTTINLASKNPVKDKNVQALLNNIMKQIDLRFVLKLPAKADASNATQVSDDGRTMMWRLPLGEEHALQASVTYLNPVKAAGWAVLFIVIGGVGSAYYRKIRRQKALADWEARQEKCDHILPLPEETVQTDKSNNKKAAEEKQKDPSKAPNDSKQEKS